MKATERLMFVVLGGCIAALAFNLWGTIKDTLDLVFLPDEDGDAPAPTPITKAKEAKAE